ncbi:MAG TPA: hypothetical protein VFC99_00375 [Acidimicrobiia bacterium]|nr:hypothetical protein [Acidimicrobiia bacterium]
MIAVAGALAGCGAGEASSTGAGDASRAAGQLHRAAAAMQQVASYRFRATVGAGASQVELAGEFEAPDRVHEHVTLSGRPAVEVVFAGSQAFVKDASGAWHHTAEAAPASGTDVRSAFGALTKVAPVARHGSNYTFRVPATAARTLVGTSAAGSIPAAATLDGDEIAALTYEPTITGHRVQVAISYSDVNRAPPVSIPTAG